MTIREFIRQHRSELEEAITEQLGRVPRTASCYCPQSGTTHRHPVDPINEEDCRQWILNDEPLYLWARREGVKI
jgi:hypothetical protein